MFDQAGVFGISSALRALQNLGIQFAGQLTPVSIGHGFQLHFQFAEVHVRAGTAPFAFSLTLTGGHIAGSGLGLLTLTGIGTLLRFRLQFRRCLRKGFRCLFERFRRLLLGSYETSLETQLELESRGISRCIGTADGREGLASFIERRKPAFKGE